MSEQLGYTEYQQSLLVGIMLSQSHTARLGFAAANVVLLLTFIYLTTSTTS